MKLNDQIKKNYELNFLEYRVGQKSPDTFSSSLTSKIGFYEASKVLHDVIRKALEKQLENAYAKL